MATFLALSPSALPVVLHVPFLERGHSFCFSLLAAVQVLLGQELDMFLLELHLDDFFLMGSSRMLTRPLLSIA